MIIPTEIVSNLQQALNHYKKGEFDLSYDCLVKASTYCFHKRIQESTEFNPDLMVIDVLSNWIQISIDLFHRIKRKDTSDVPFKVLDVTLEGCLALIKTNQVVKTYL